MSKIKANPVNSASLPRRDLWLLPLVCMLTLLVTLFVFEVVARHYVPVSTDDICLVPDGKLGIRYKPNCTSISKTFESPPVYNRYNECGYRGNNSCGPKAPDTDRIVLLGSSFAVGYLVPEQNTFAVRMAEDISRRCRASVEVVNMGGYLVFWARVLNRMDQVLSLKPNLVLFQISSYDIDRPDPGNTPWKEVDEKPRSFGIVEKMHDLLIRSRAWRLIQYYMSLNDELYTKLFLQTKDRSDYLRSPLTLFWKSRLSHFDQMIGLMADRLHSANVSFGIIFIPQKGQLEVATYPQNGLKPYQLDDEVESIAKKHGAVFIDTTAALQSYGHPARLYYPYDTHLNSEGHLRVETPIADAVVSDFEPFKSCIHNPPSWKSR